MIYDTLVTTVNQKILQFLTKYTDKEFHEREIVRRIGVSSGSANRALNALFATGAVKRRQEWRMLFYSIDSSNPAITEFKKLINILLIESLTQQLKNVSKRIILYGSCAQGTDNSKSDVDIFIVTNERDRVIRIIDNFHFPQGYEGLHVQAIIKTPTELLKIGESEQVFLNEVEKGITLWESAANESRI
jgi:predicted nucleotidyltransferase